MEVHFDNGHFQRYVNGEKRADFIDTEFLPSEIVRLVVIGNGLRAGHRWVDSFKISATEVSADSTPGLSVSHQGKLAIIW